MAAKLNLESMSLEQLTQLQHDAAVLLQQRRQERVGDVASQVVELITGAGFTVSEIIDAIKPGRSRRPGVKPAFEGTRVKAAIKYRSVAGDTWSGRGKQPTWLAAHIAAGGTLEQVAV